MTAAAPAIAPAPPAPLPPPLSAPRVLAALRSALDQVGHEEAVQRRALAVAQQRLALLALTRRRLGERIDDLARIVAEQEAARG